MLLGCSLSLLFVFSTDLVYASSFYDNPEQDPLPLQGTAEDLRERWNFEV